MNHQSPRIPKPQVLSLHSRSSPSALAELRAKLPAGGPGSIINSYIFPSHPHAIAYQRALHVEMAAQREAQQPRIICPMVTLVCDYDGDRWGRLRPKGTMRIQECTMCNMVVRVYIGMNYNAKHYRHIANPLACCAWEGSHPVAFFYNVKPEVECLNDVECPRCEDYHHICFECGPIAVAQGFECAETHTHVNVRELRGRWWVLT
jgi:hypothetical protein